MGAFANPIGLIVKHGTSVVILNIGRTFRTIRVSLTTVAPNDESFVLDVAVEHSPARQDDFHSNTEG